MGAEKKRMNEFIKKNTACMVEFWAPWCGPCKKLEPILDEVAKLYPIMKINIEEAQELASEYMVQSVPTMIYFENSKPMRQLNGLKTKQQLIDEFEI